MSTEGVIAPLKRVVVENFRSIRKLELALDPRVTVLFGANAAGKTSVLDAIAIGLGAIVARVQDAGRREFARNDIRVPRKDRPELGEGRGARCAYARVELTGANELVWDFREFRTPADRDRILYDRASPGYEWPGCSALHEVIDPLVSASHEYDPGPDETPDLTNAEPLPPDEVRKMYEDMGAAHEAAQRPFPLVAAYGTERAIVDLPVRERDFQREFERLEALDDALSAVTRFRTVFEWFRVMEDEERRERDRQRNFEYLLPALQWVRLALTRADLRCRNPRVETKPLRMLVDFEHPDGASEELELSSLSDGYRTYFSLIVDIARRMVQLNPSEDLADPIRGTNSEAVILIDEIDLHLDPTRQAAAVKGLLDAFPRAQFVVTTHSEQVIGSVDASCVRKLVVGDGELMVEAVEFAQGATGERILIELMDAPERVPGPVTAELTKYLQLVDAGKGASDEALALRSRLNQKLAGDPQLQHATLEMERRELMEKLKGFGGGP